MPLRRVLCPASAGQWYYQFTSDAAGLAHWAIQIFSIRPVDQDFYAAADYNSQRRYGVSRAVRRNRRGRFTSVRPPHNQTVMGQMGFWALVFPTANANPLGNGKYQAGPAFALIYTGIKNFTVGAIVQNPISYAGSPNRPNVNNMLITPTCPDFSDRRSSRQSHETRQAALQSVG